MAYYETGVKVALSLAVFADDEVQVSREIGNVFVEERAKVLHF